MFQQPENYRIKFVNALDKNVTQLIKMNFYFSIIIRR